jgi:hydroxypyruvate isomerase
MAFKQAVSRWPLKDLSDEQIRQIREIGIEGIEMPPPQEYSRWQDSGFAIATIVGHQSLTDGLNKKENHARIADEIRANLEVAKQNKIAGLICFSGNRNGISEEEGAANTIEGLSVVADDAEKAGVTLLVELLNSKVDHDDYQCDRTAWGAQVMREVNSPRVKLLFDIYHMQIMEGDLIRNIRDHIEYIGHFHTAGNPGRLDLDDEQEIFYPAIARAIRDTGFDGWVGHEFSPKGDVVSALRQAYDALKI